MKKQTRFDRLEHWPGRLRTTSNGVLIDAPNLLKQSHLNGRVEYSDMTKQSRIIEEN
jgi:hypothetical protein